MKVIAAKVFDGVHANPKRNEFYILGEGIDTGTYVYVSPHNGGQPFVKKVNPAVFWELVNKTVPVNFMRCEEEDALHNVEQLLALARSS